MNVLRYIQDSRQYGEISHQTKCTVCTEWIKSGKIHFKRDAAERDCEAYLESQSEFPFLISSMLGIFLRVSMTVTWESLTAASFVFMCPKQPEYLTALSSTEGVTWLASDWTQPDTLVISLQCLLLLPLSSLYLHDFPSCQKPTMRKRTNYSRLHSTVARCCRQVEKRDWRKIHFLIPKVE